MNTRLLQSQRSDLPSLNETLIRDPQTYPQFSISHASEIDDHLRGLIAIQENADLFFSIYLNLTTEDTESDLRRMVSSLAPGLDDESLFWLFQAESCLLDLLGNRLRDEHKGLAIHFRGGSIPTVKAIAFHLPVISWACADRTPNLVPLIEMRDSFDRYVVLISEESHARIVEVVVGSVTREAWLQRPHLREKLSSEWGREHYRNHQVDREQSFISEKIGMLETLLSKGGYGHIILAGDPKRIDKIEKALPSWLRQRVVDVCNLKVSDRREQIVLETISSFVDQEIYESRTTLERLKSLVLKGGSNAAIGLDACELALYQGNVETLVVAKAQDEKRGIVRVFRHRTRDGNYLTIEKRRQRIMNKAVELGIQIECVDQDTFLNDYGGVGAILRYGSNLELKKAI